MIENYPSGSPRLDRKSGLLAGEQRLETVIWVISYGLSLAFALSVAFRLPFFFTPPRLQRFGFLLIGGLCTLLVYRGLFQIALRKLTDLPSRKRIAWLVAAVLAGCLIAVVLPLPPSQLQTSHMLSIEAVPPQNGLAPITVDILEIRRPDGLAIPSSQFVLNGSWRVAGQGVQLTSQNPARLSSTFIAPNGNLDILLVKNPQGGLVRITADGIYQEINLFSKKIDHFHLWVQLNGVSRQAQLLRVADFVTLVSLISLLLYIASYYAARVITERRISFHVTETQYHLSFLIVLLVLLLLPLQTTMGNLRVLDTTFWGRADLLRGWNNFRAQLMGDRIFKSFLITDRYWMAYTGDLSLDDYQNTALFTEADLKSLQQRLDVIHDRLTANGITFLIVIPPNKNTIYPEYIPREIQVVGKQSRLDQVVNYLNEHAKTKVLDLRSALLTARKDRPVYYATDTHWNPYGAWIGYREILTALQKDYPNLKPYPIEDYQYTPLGMLPGDIASNLGPVVIEEEQYKLSLKAKKSVETWTSAIQKTTPKDIETISEKPTKKIMEKPVVKAQVITTWQPDSSLPNLLMYCDSFCNQLTPLLSDNFSRAVYVTSYSIDQQYIDAEKPDIVIYEATERWLSGLFFLQ